MRTFLVVASALVLLLAVGVVATIFALRGPAMPQRDFEAELAVLIEGEDGIPPEAVAAFERLVLLGGDAERMSLDAFDEVSAELPGEHQFLGLDPIDLKLLAEPLPEDPDPFDVWNRRASERVMAAYTASGTIAELEALRDRQIRRPLPSGDPTTLAGGSSELLTLARYEAARARIAFAAGDDAVAIGALRNVTALARVFEQEPKLVSHLVAIAMRSGQTEAIRRTLLRGGLDPATARELLDVLSAAPEPTAGLRPAIEGERLEMHILIDRLYRSGDVSTWRRLVADRGSLYARTEAVFDELTALAEERVLGGNGAEQRVHAAAGPRWRFPLLHALAPAITKVVRNTVSTELELDGTRLMLALEIHRAEHGGYPASLDALVPAILPALPEDGFAPDGRYRYRLVEPGELAHVPMGYVLSSVGSDGVDDGGAIPAVDGDVDTRRRAAVAARESGVDYVINATGADE